MSAIIIQAKLRDDQLFLEACILLLWHCQTKDEQSVMDSHHQNGEGFTKADALILSEYAEQIHTHLHLHQEDVHDASKRMLKYATQLSTILTEEQLFTLGHENEE